MMRIKIPQGILLREQLDALASVAERYSRGFGHITTRQNVQLHFVKLHDAEPAMRELAAAGMTTREACGNSVRNITACPYSGVAKDEAFDVTPYAEALTRYLLRHPLSSSCRASSRSRSRAAPRITSARRSTTSAGTRGFRRSTAARSAASGSPSPAAPRR